MKEVVNRNLITLKCVIFCFLSGVGCIFPFLPLHMLAVGLEKPEARLISAVAPCVALLGPAIVGPLLDRLSVGRGSTGGAGAKSSGSGNGKLLRTVTAICFILSALFYLLLLSVPFTQRHKDRRPQVLFMCDEDGAYVMQEACTNITMRCNNWNGEKSGVLAVTACEYGCADENMTWLLGAFPKATTTTTPSNLFYANENEPEPQALMGDPDENEEYEMNPPHLCTDGQCHVYMQHAGRLRIPLSLVAPTSTASNETQISLSKWCTFRTAGPSKCVVPPARVDELREKNPECRPAVRCEVVDPYEEPGTVLADVDCSLVEGDPEYTFWSYFIIRVLADVWPTTGLALIGTACVIATRETSLGRGDIGRQLAFGTIGLAIFPPLAGLAAQEVPSIPYFIPFVMHALFMLIGAIILVADSGMPLSTPEWWWHTSTGVLAMPMNSVRRYGAETAAIFTVVTLLGLLWSAIDAYLPWTAKELMHNETDTLIGLTLTIGALPAIPALWWAESVVDYLGHSNIFIAAFTFYCLRFTALGFGTDYTWLLVCEALEVFTISLVWVTAVLYFRHLIPRKFTSTGQALPVIAHFGLGRCIGAILGSLVSAQTELDSAREVYRALAVCSLVAAAVYLPLYHLLLAPRCQAPTVAPPTTLLQGLTSNGTSNGNYSPIRVYHEERARKGQFRY